jgi:hypothetical protein
MRLKAVNNIKSNGDNSASTSNRLNINEDIEHDMMNVGSSSSSSASNGLGNDDFDSADVIFFNLSVIFRFVQLSRYSIYTQLRLNWFDKLDFLPTIPQLKLKNLLND